MCRSVSLQAVVLLVLFACVTFAQVCVPANATAVAVCQPYLPAGLVYSSTDPLFVASSTTVFRAIRQLGTLNGNHVGVSRTCVDLAARYLCLGLFAPCLTVPGNVTAYRQRCSNVCTELNTEPGCAANLTSVLSVTLNVSAALRGYLQPACGALNPTGTPYLDGQPIFGDATWAAGGQNTVVPCYTSAVIPQSATSFACWLPFVATDPNAPDGPNGYCEFICPRLLSIQADGQALYTIIIYWIIWPLALFTILVRLSIPRFARYPANLVLLMLFGWFLAAFTLAVSMVPNWRAAVCNANKLPGTVSNPARCGFQAFTWLFGILLGHINWTIICIHSAIAVVVQKPIFGRLSMWLSYGIGFFLPLLLALIPVGANQITNLNTNPYCFPTANYAFSVYFAWLGLGLLIGMPCLTLVFVQMLRTSDSSSAWALKNNIRLFCFLLVGFWYAAWAFGYRFYFVPISNDLGLAYNWWAGCSIYQANCPRGGLDGPGPGVLLNDGSIWAWTVATHTTGLFACLLFLAQRELWTGWGDRIAPWSGLVAAATPATEATASTAGSSSSSSASSAEAGTFVSDLQ